MSLPLITSPRRERLSAVLEAIVENPASLGARATNATGLFIEHDALVWFDYESLALAKSRQRHIARKRAENSDLSKIVWPPIIQRMQLLPGIPPKAPPFQSFPLRTLDPGEIWEILATRGLIPESWVGANPPAMVQDIFCLACEGSGRNHAGERCEDCFGLGDRRTISHRPHDMASAITLAVDAPSVAVAEELVREIEPAEMGSFPIGWRCVNFEEHIRRSRQVSQASYSHESDRVVHARVALHSLGVTLGAPDSRTMTWIEIDIPSLGQAPGESPAAAPVPTMPPLTCLSMAPTNWTTIQRNPEPGEPSSVGLDETQKGLMDRIRAWVKKMSREG